MIVLLLWLLCRLKGKFPRAFQALCLYAEVSGLHSRYNLRLFLRRFLQEIYDMPYTEFYEVAGEIVRREAVKEDEEEPSQQLTQQEEKKIVQEVHPVLSVPTLEDEERTHFNVPTTSSSLSSQSKEGKKTEAELHLKYMIIDCQRSFTYKLL
jgi:hypothetical protein